jgi:hypothetical protein
VRRPADAWPSGPTGHAPTSRDHQKEPHQDVNGVLSLDLDSSTIRALRGGQRDGPCDPW